MGDLENRNLIGDYPCGDAKGFSKLHSFKRHDSRRDYLESDSMVTHPSVVGVLSPAIIMPPTDWSFVTKALCIPPSRPSFFFIILCKVSVRELFYFCLYKRFFRSPLKGERCACLLLAFAFKSK